MTERPWLDAIEGITHADDQLVPQQDQIQNSIQPRKVASQHRVYLWVAEVIHEKLPSRDDFKKYSCLQVSNSQASFAWSNPTISERIIVALGTTTEALYLLAKVTSCTEMPHGQYQVDCEFLERYGK